MPPIVISARVIFSGLAVPITILFSPAKAILFTIAFKYSYKSLIFVLSFLILLNIVTKSSKNIFIFASLLNNILV